MKVKNYHAASDAATVRQNLDKWQIFQQVTETTYKTTGQNVQKVQAALLATATMTISTAGVISVGTSNTAIDIPQNGTLLVNGAYYTLTSATIAAGSTGATLGTVNPFPGVAVTAATSANVFLVTNQGLSCTAWVGTNTLDTVTIKAHGINIYDTFPQKFFNAYTSYHYGGPNINTPEDAGLCFIPFCLYPGTYQPLTDSIYKMNLIVVVIIKVMASQITTGDILKLRETLAMCYILSLNRNIQMATGKPSW